MTELTAEKISFHFNKKHDLFTELSLSVKSGEIHTILGPNGIGKSTLLQVLIGKLKPQSGDVWLNQKALKKLDAKKRAQTLAFVPQIGAVEATSSLMVLDYLLLGKTPYLNVLQTPTEADLKEAQALLKQLGLEKIAQQSFSELSGGQQQLVMIARALMQKPEIIVLDEPTSALDLANQRKVLQLIKQLAEADYGVLLTTHDPNQAILLNGTVSLFTRSGTLESGSVPELITSEKLSETYATTIEVVDIKEKNRKVVLLN